MANEDISTSGSFLLEEEGDAKPQFLFERQRTADSSDESPTLSRYLTQSGSFDLGGVQSSSLGRFLHALPIPAMLIDISNIVLFTNRSCEKLSPKYHHIKGTSFLDLFPDPGASAEIAALAQSVFVQRKPQICEGALQIHGRDAWCRLHLRSIRMEADRFALIMIEDLSLEKKHEEELRKAHDQLDLRVRERTAELAQTNEQLTREVEQRRQTEEALRESEQRLRTIFEAAEDCIFVKDRSLRYTHVNRATETLFETPASKLIGLKDEDLFGPEESASMMELDRRVLEGAMIELERTRLVRGIATTFDEIRIPIRDSQGNITGICGMFRNITDRSKAAKGWTPITSAKVRSEAMLITLESALMVSQTDSTLLLLGESGSGKDYLARYIHENSLRSNGPYFAINCAALAPEIVESELFGHESGAFTGALRRKRGLLELAEGGTLLLNEIGELPLPAQAKLLSFFDTKSFTRVGGQKEVRVDVRIIAATNKDLEAEVKEGQFRLDLYYRLNVVTIVAPPLRERLEDLPALAQEILGLLATQMGLTTVPKLAEEFIKELQRYDWPGNVRELRNVLERWLIIPQKGNVTLSALGLGQTLKKEWSYAVEFPEGNSLNDITKGVKKALVQEALVRSKGNRKAAARLLKIPYDSLRHYLRSLGVE